MIGDGTDGQGSAGQQRGRPGIDCAAPGTAEGAAGAVSLRDKQKVGGAGPGAALRGRGKDGGGLARVGCGQNGGAAAIQIDDSNAALRQQQLGGLDQRNAGAQGGLTAVTFQNPHGAILPDAQNRPGRHLCGGVGGELTVSCQHISAAGAPDHIVPGGVLRGGIDRHLIAHRQVGKGHAGGAAVRQTEHQLIRPDGRAGGVCSGDYPGLELAAQTKGIALHRLQHDLRAGCSGSGRGIKILRIEIDAGGGAHIVQGMDGPLGAVRPGEGDGQLGRSGDGCAVFKKAHGIPTAVGGGQPAVLNGHARGHAGAHEKEIGVHRRQHPVAHALRISDHRAYGGFSVDIGPVEDQRPDIAAGGIVQRKQLPQLACVGIAVALRQRQALTQVRSDRISQRAGRQRGKRQGRRRQRQRQKQRGETGCDGFHGDSFPDKAGSFQTASLYLTLQGKNTPENLNKF